MTDRVKNFSNHEAVPDELDMLLTTLFQEDRHPTPDPEFTRMIKRQLTRRQRLRSFLLILASLLGLILASSALSALPSLVATMLAELNSLASVWALLPAIIDASSIEPVLLMLAAGVAATLFSRMLEE